VRERARVRENNKDMMIKDVKNAVMSDLGIFDIFLLQSEGLSD
jgi:hypothetical protein